MPRLTDAEYDALDEELTLNPPAVDPARARYGPGVRERDFLSLLNKAEVEYILSRIDSTHRTPAEVVGALIREELARSA